MPRLEDSAQALGVIHALMDTGFYVLYHVALEQGGIVMLVPYNDDMLLRSPDGVEWVVQVDLPSLLLCLLG